jgi:hypothetical protein
VADETGLTPKQIASLRAQLEAANARLACSGAWHRELQVYIATLTAQLKRAESGGRSE